jgi:hypothetical protein
VRALGALAMRVAALYDIHENLPRALKRFCARLSATRQT